MSHQREVQRRAHQWQHPPQPTVEDILGSDHPGRARTYWRDAIKLPQQQSIVGYYKELEALAARRKEWQDAWLDQPLDIRPPPEEAKPLADLARRARNAKRTRSASRT